jgi:NRPS condensation-like uncharacterized protein
MKPQVNKGTRHTRVARTKYKVEIFDIWHYLSRAYSEPLIRCRIDFSSRIDEGALRKAVMLSLDAVPLINACFDDKPFKPRWVGKAFTGNDIIHVVEVDSDTDEQIIQLYSSNIDFATEPQLKIHLIRRPRGDTACIIINHMICDAAGFKEYLYLLSALYTRVINNETPPPLEYRSRGVGQIFAGISWAEKLSILRLDYSAYDTSSEKEQKGITFTEGADTPIMETVVVSKEDFLQMKTSGREKGATMNDMIMAAFARVFCLRAGIDEITLPCTMDLRKYVPSGQYGIGNLSAICMCKVSVQEDDLFEEALKQVSAQMQSYKSSKTILKSVMLWNLTTHLVSFRSLKRDVAKIVKRSVACFSNLGIIQDELMNFGDTPIENIALTAAVRPNPCLQLTASTYRGTCTLSCNIYGDDCDKEWVRRFLQDVYSELRA